MIRVHLLVAVSLRPGPGRDVGLGEGRRGDGRDALGFTRRERIIRCFRFLPEATPSLMTLRKRWMTPAVALGALTIGLIIVVTITRKSMSPQEKLRAQLAEENARITQEMRDTTEKLQAIQAQVRAGLAAVKTSASSPAPVGMELPPDQVQHMTQELAIEDIPQMIAAYQTEPDDQLLYALGGKLGRTKDPRALAALRASLGKNLYSMPAFLGGLDYGGAEGDALCADAYPHMDDDQKHEARRELEMDYQYDKDFRALIDHGGFPKLTALCPFDRKTQ